MSAKPPSHHDLPELLHEWRVDLPEDPALARQVWARIEADTLRRPVSGLEWFSLWCARPMAVAAAISLFALGGAVVGELRIASARESRVAQLAAEYARSIDPILMTHSGAGHSAHTP